MESILNTLCHTVATLQGQMKKEDRPKSSEAKIEEQRALMSAREQAVVDQVRVQIFFLLYFLTIIVNN
jgi:hypothetical protein